MSPGLIVECKCRLEAQQLDLGSSYQKTGYRSRKAMVGQLAWPERKKMEESKMSEEFHDWLDKCPVIWFRGEVTRDHVTYSFETPEDEEE